MRKLIKPSQFRMISLHHEGITFLLTEFVSGSAVALNPSKTISFYCDQYFSAPLLSSNEIHY